MEKLKNLKTLDIKIGTIIEAIPSTFSGIPAFKLQVDFGSELGIKFSAAHFSQYHQPEDLIGRQVLAVVNVPPQQVADFISEVLVLGTYSDEGIVFVTPWSQQ